MAQPQAPIRAVLVDLDGTLVDTVGDFTVALGAMLAEWGAPPLAAATVQGLVGKGSQHLVRQALTHQGLSSDEAAFAHALARYLHHYGRINGQHSTVYPGVVEGLQQMRARGLLLACLTNKPAAHARQLLAAKGLDGYFADVFGGDSFARKKPDPLPLRQACRLLEQSPAGTLMVGDSSNDAQAARAAGCPVVLVTYGYNHGQPARQIQADGWLDRFDQLTDWLDGC